MTSRVAQVLPVLAWMTLIFVMSSREQFPEPFGLSTFLLAIAAHLFLYGVLAVLTLFAIDSNFPQCRASVMAVVIAVLYGVTDEIHQSFVPGRDASFFDLIVNTIGAALAITFWTRRRAILAAVIDR